VIAQPIKPYVVPTGQTYLHQNLCEKKVSTKNIAITNTKATLQPYIKALEKIPTTFIISKTK
jgi:hypothetical protein